MASDLTSDFVHSYKGVPFGPPWSFGGTIISDLVQKARRQAQDPFVTTVDADGKVTTLRYGDIDRLSRRSAALLEHDFGVTPGDVVAVIPRNDHDSIITIFGALRTGAGVLLLSPSDPVSRLEPQVAKARAKVVLRSPAVAPDHYPASIGIPESSTLREEPSGRRDPDLDPSADALFFGTSGSTAAAKLVAQSHYNVVVNAAAVRSHHALRRGDRVLGCLPIHHVNGLHFTIFGVLFAGAHVMLPHKFEPFGYSRLLDDFNPRMASLVPSLLEVLLTTRRKRSVPSEFEYFLSAAAPLDKSTLRRVEQSMGVRVLQGYGLTETTNFSTTMPLNMSAETYRRLTTEVESPSVGVALPGNEIAILRPDGTAAGPGEVGEICMRGHNVMTRYVRNPEATASAFRYGWFHSQDLGFEVIDSNQRFIVIVGRSKNIAKVGGETVSLDEMERELRALPEVRDAACTTTPSPYYGQEIVALVAFVPGMETDVRARLSTSFSAAALPRRVVSIDAVPRTATGKILRPQLAEMLASLEKEER